MVTLYTVKEYVRHMIKRIAGRQKCHRTTAVNLLFFIGRILGNGTFPDFCHLSFCAEVRAPSPHRLNLMLYYQHTGQRELSNFISKE